MATPIINTEIRVVRYPGAQATSSEPAKLSAKAPRMTGFSPCFSTSTPAGIDITP